MQCGSGHDVSDSRGRRFRSLLVHFSDCSMHDSVEPYGGQVCLHMPKFRSVRIEGAGHA